MNSRCAIAAEAFLREHVRPQDRVADVWTAGPGPAQPFTANVAAARHQLELVRGGARAAAKGAVAEMSVTEAYEILRGNELVLSRYTAQQACDTAAGGVSANDLVKRFANDPAVLRRLLRENAQSIVNQADADSRRFLQATWPICFAVFAASTGERPSSCSRKGFTPTTSRASSRTSQPRPPKPTRWCMRSSSNRRADLIGRGDLRPPMTRWKRRIGSSRSAVLPRKRAAMLVKDASTRLDAAFAALLPDDGGYYLSASSPRCQRP